MTPPATRWLSEAESRTWALYRRMSTVLDSTLDRQLQNDAGIPHGYYTILANLSAAPNGSRRMTALADSMRASQSRVSHAVAALEKRGWVRREKCTDDSRGTRAVLTREGKRQLKTAAPAHVELVRAVVFDQLTPAQVTQLGEICAAVLSGLDPERATEST